MMTNQCDWQSNVDCRFNKNPGLLSSTQSDHQVDPQVSYQTIKQLSLQTLDRVVHILTYSLTHILNFKTKMAR